MPRSFFKMLLLSPYDKLISARAAGLISKRWYDKYKYAPDAIVVEGPLPGGHLGFSNKRPYKCPYHCIISCKEESSPYCISLALMNAKRGRTKNRFAFAGANAYRVEKIMSVQELIQIMPQFHQTFHIPENQL